MDVLAVMNSKMATVSEYVEARRCVAELIEAADEFVRIDEYDDFYLTKRTRLDAAIDACRPSQPKSAE